MSERTVVVRLVANIGDYRRGLTQASVATKGLGREVATATGKGAEGYKQIGLAASATGAAIAVGLGKAVGASMGFEKQLSSLRAATGANAASMELLRQAALRTGKDTSFSASEAAQAQVELAKAGVSVADALGGALTGAVDLAAAGTLDVASAAEIAATSMVQFKLSGQDVPRIADLLAAAAGKAQGEVSDMAMALKQGGLVASQAGWSIEETTGVLAQFASAGLLGSDAGTSLRTGLLRLMNPSGEAADLMDRLGISVYDASGQFVSAEGLAAQLRSQLSGLSEEQRNAALATIFGSDAIRAATILYKDGAEGVALWQSNVNDAGFASRTAATMTDNLSGDLERLGGSIETALIENGTAANGVLRTLVQTADGAVGVFSDLPGPVQGVATAAAGLTGAVGLAAGAFLLGAPKVTAFKSSLEDMGPRSQRFGKGILGVGAALGGPWGLALAGGVTALGLFAKAKADAKAEVDAFTEAITADSGAIGENARQTAVAALEKRGMLQAAEDLGVSLKTVTDAALGDRAALDELRTVAADYNDTALNMADAGYAASSMLDENAVAAGVAAGEARSLVGDVEDLAGATQEGMDAARRNAEALGEQGGAQQQLGAAVQDTTTSVQEQTESLADLMEKVRALSDQVLGMRSSEREFQAAIDDATAAVAKNGRTLDIGTEKGRANEAALDAIASSANDVLTAMAESEAPIDAVSTKMAQQREALVKAAVAFGMTEAEANVYADSVLRIPTKRETAIVLNGVQGAIAQVGTLQQYLQALKDKTITVTTRRQDVIGSQLRIAGQTGPGGYASGGLITGPGSGTSDSILGVNSFGMPTARVSDGEFVQREAAVQKYGLGFMHAVNSLSLSQDAARQSMRMLTRMPTTGADGLVRLATGGPVRPVAAGMSLSQYARQLAATPVRVDATATLLALVGEWA